MNDQEREEAIDLLQQLHELTQQNCPESAGAAWLAFLEDVVINNSAGGVLRLDGLKRAIDVG